jgi:hypothetical protein
MSAATIVASTAVVSVSARFKTLYAAQYARGICQLECMVAEEAYNVAMGRLADEKKKIGKASPDYHARTDALRKSIPKLLLAVYRARTELMNASHAVRTARLRAFTRGKHAPRKASMCPRNLTH